MWLGVKYQTNVEIACSPRNRLRASVDGYLTEVEHWMGEGADCLPNPTKLRMPSGERRQLDGGR